jgi:MSHA biogenesis protein MshN
VVVVEGGMSVINKMLQDLDRRQALGAGTEPAVVRAPGAKVGGHEWFWRILVVLLAAALAWMGWVAVQLMPRKPLATDLAFKAAAEARTKAGAITAPTAAAPAVPPSAPPAQPAAPAAPTEEAQAVPAVAAPAAPVEEPKPTAAAPASDALRLSLKLETPVAPRPAEPSKPQAHKPESVQPESAKTESAKPKATPAQPRAAAKGIDKRERLASDTAEAHFRRAALLLGHGRISEAEDRLMAALRADASHTGARQAYVALLLEQQRISVAQRLLQEGLAINPEQPALAVALSRIYVGQRDYTQALAVLDRAGSATGTAEFQAMRAAVLQRLGRHGEAIEAYQNALRTGAQPATTWIGLGISLEGLGRKDEAAAAYRRALTAGPIAMEAREYAESRARALE